MGPRHTPFPLPRLAHLPVLVLQRQQHRPAVALHPPVQAPQTEAIPRRAEGQTPGMPSDSCGEVEAELGTGLEVSEGSPSSQPPCRIPLGSQED